MPQGLDAFVYTERGVYRTGETVRLTALLRDAQARAVGNQAVFEQAQRGQAQGLGGARRGPTDP